MILKEQTLNIIEGGFGEVIESKINQNKLSKLFGMLSNLYRNVPESIVRETVTNAWDSHKEAGKEHEPIIIKLDNTVGEEHLLIKDVGLGMSPEFMQSTFFNDLDGRVRIAVYQTGGSNNLNNKQLIEEIYE